MSRWPMLAVLVIVLLAGCAPSMEVGLANAPRLGGSGDDRVHDVVSNGGDSCGRYAEYGPLRGRIPPCPAVAAHPVASVMPPPAPGQTKAAAEEGLVIPWLQHFYVGWPCQAPPLAVSEKTVACGR
jgi:hypothetical protein